MSGTYIAGQTDGVGKHRRGNYILLNSGTRFFIQDPRPEEISIEDIAHSLALQNRFSGHTKSPYSVGDHSLHCAQLIEDQFHDKKLTLTALLHDASEAVLVDLPRPIKALEQLGAEYRELEETIQEVISKKFDLIYPFPAEINWSDMVLLVTEQRDLMPWPEGEEQWFPEVDPMEQYITPRPWNVVKQRFLWEFNRLNR